MRSRVRRLCYVRFRLLNNNENDSLRSDSIVRLHVMRRSSRAGWLDSASAMTSPVPCDASRECGRLRRVVAMSPQAEALSRRRLAIIWIYVRRTAFNYYLAGVSTAETCGSRPATWCFDRLAETITELRTRIRGHSLTNWDSCPTPAESEAIEYLQVGPTEIGYSIAWTIFVYL